MPTKRAPQERDNIILEAYEAWDPTQSTLQALADSLGVSRSTIYNVLERNQVEPKGQRPDGETIRGDELMSRMADMALTRILDDLTECRQWIQASIPVMRRYIDDPEVANLLADRP